MVQLLSPLQPRSSGGTARRQTWHEWLAKPDMVSAVTLLAAGEIAGLAWAQMLREEAEAAYQAPARRGELVGQDQRMARLEDEVATLRETIANVREESANLRRLVEDALPVSAPLTSRVQAAEERLGERARERRKIEGL